MDALDLTQRPPRSPRLLLDDIDLLFLARTVDKLRAMLPGGKLGEYRMQGFSARMLENLGVPQEDFLAEIARADSETAIAEWFRENTDASQFEAMNIAMEEPSVQDRFNNAEWMSRYPNAKGVPPDTKLIDFMVIDDKEMFEGRSPGVTPPAG